MYSNPVSLATSNPSLTLVPHKGNNILEKLPNELLKIIVKSYLSTPDASNLAATHKNFKAFVIESIELDRTKRLLTLTKIFYKTGKIPTSEIENFCHNLKFFKISFTSLLTKQVAKKSLGNSVQPLAFLSTEQEIKKKEALEKSSDAANRLQTFEQEFMESLFILWDLKTNYIESGYFEEQKKIFDTDPSACVVDFALALDCISDFNLITKHYFNSPFYVPSIIKAHGTHYFPILEKFFSKIDLPNQYWSHITCVVKALLLEKRLKTAIKFVNKLMQQRLSSPYQLNANQAKAAINELHSIIMYHYIEKNDLLGAIKALKTISGDFGKLSTCCLNRVINLAIEIADYPAIVDLLDFYQISNLDSNEQFFLELKQEIHFGYVRATYKSTNQKIAKGLKLIQFIPKNCIDIKISLLYKIKDFIKPYKSEKLLEIFHSIERRITNNWGNSELLSYTLNKLPKKKEYLDLAFEIFLIMKDEQKPPYAKELFQLFRNENNDAQANAVAVYIPAENEPLR